MGQRARTRPRIAAPTLLLALALLVLWGAGRGAEPASADFSAQPCAGATDRAPSAQSLAITGRKLADYEAGGVVILYAPDGGTPSTGGVPLCTVRELDGAPVSEWAYCTDYGKSSCGEVDEAGQPRRDSPGPIGGNARLNAEQERLISYLIQHGYPIRDPGVAPGLSHGQTQADSTTTARRLALQALVWCVSDPQAADLQPFCAANLGSGDRAQILARTPPTPQLTLSGPSGELQVGQTARFTLRTNLIGQPITVQATNGARLTVCGGSATLRGDQLTVTRAGTVTLCATGTRPGAVSLTAAATPPSTRAIGWNWNGDPECQVFATFDTVEAPDLVGAASVSFRSRSETPGTPGAPSSSPVPTPSKATPGAKLCVTKRVRPRVVRAGRGLVWTIVVRNCGKRTVRSVRACDRIASGVRFVRGNRRSRVRSGLRCFELGTLRPRAKRTIVVRIRTLRGAGGTRCAPVIVGSPDARRVTASACARIVGTRAPSGGVTG